MIPKKATIRVYHTTDDEIKNKIEELLRDSIWEHIPENKISIEFD